MSPLTAQSEPKVFEFGVDKLSLTLHHHDQLSQPLTMMLVPPHALQGRLLLLTFQHVS